MRHQKHGKKLGRSSAHRRAMWSNMVTSLLEHERIKTTDVKAKEVRRLADKTINWAVALGDLVNKDAEKLDAEEKGRKLHALRMAKRIVKDPAVLTKLFSEIGPRYLGATGGYVRVLKYGYRHGDAAPVSIVELVKHAESDAPAKGGKGADEASA